MPQGERHSHNRGFTLIELLVVLAIMATLLSIVAPRYSESVDRAKEATLKTNLRILRESIDKYRADTGKLPEALDRLVAARYIQAVPVDPITDQDNTWLLVPHPDGITPGIYDVHSAAEGVGRDGKPFNQW
ncbi:type II secretion system protein [Aquabacterium sp. CECT 9606]|uniref:type II secretion system protein n=1 Tax=Aquabacterium sp. CECT 9606 TaxID=2845822 RepID=UPI002113133C|nr:prepilin-type N-terminal cleavage/methylation domain-containing protein [Aquabacterium sp. CECT 9606]